MKFQGASGGIKPKLRNFRCAAYEFPISNREEACRGMTRSPPTVHAPVQQVRRIASKSKTIGFGDFFPPFRQPVIGPSSTHFALFRAPLRSSNIGGSINCHGRGQQPHGRKVVRVQQVDATLPCSLLAGVWNSEVFRGRLLRRSAILSSSDWV